MTITKYWKYIITSNIKVSPTADNSSILMPVLGLVISGVEVTLVLA